MAKFDRNYKLFVETSTGTTIEISRPFTIEFDIQRDTLSSVNIASFRIFNLSEKNRNLIRKDAWNFQDIRKVSFDAGYGDNLPTLAVGNISQAWSVREGNNFITTIETFDGGWAFSEAQTNLQFPAGTPNQAVVQSLAQNMNSFGVTTGAIGIVPGVLARGNSYSGNTANLLSEVSGGSFFVDNGKVNVLSDTEAIAALPLLISSDSGLIGTPVRENTYLKFDVLFEPQVQVGYLVILASLTGANFNGIHKVYSLAHKGIVSEVVSGNATTTVGVIDGNFVPIASSS